MKIVFIGNSIVNGFPWKRSESFPSLVRQRLNGEEFRGSIPRGMNMKFEVINKGVNGDTTAGILNRFERDVLQQKPDYVFLLTGTNDFIYGEAGREDVLTNIRTIVARCRRSGITPVLMTSIPVNIEQATECWRVGEGIDYQWVQSELADVSNIFLDYGIQENIKVIDTNKEYKKCLQYHDGIHPTLEGQEFIADTIMDFMQAELS